MIKAVYGDYQPLAAPGAIIQGPHYRFTILTSRLIRAEYSPTGTFYDGQTQTVLNRDFPVPHYEIREREDLLEIITDHVLIQYDKQAFSREGLVFKLRGYFSIYHSDWHYGDPIQDLGGTAQTLDHANGAVPLERGLMSRFGFSVLDDSQSLQLTQDGWYQVKQGDSLDFYYFGYGHDYRACLADFYRLTGPQPLLPKYALGNWWSRFYRYSEATYRQLIERFEAEGLPFTVAVIDMDWHVVSVPPQYGSGWTGYTWNEELFPDPAGFMAWLHQHGLRITLNVHPADGVRPFESMYQQMAQELGLDWEGGEYVVFDPTSPRFLEAYFKHLHHPKEEQGVDFWWIDWQQGQTVKGVDPLWVLNHYHYHDIQARGPQGITFSRYAGPGSHRYPVGFSGDSHMTWESLDFQPYFTATASNIGYGWWSHDIGGHIFGYRDNELALRWYQLGVFSPIMRLHSSSSEFLGKEPWRYPEPYASSMKDYLRLRHRLLPYLYTMNYRAAYQAQPLIEPLYYQHPEEEAAYEIANQYYFGSQIMVMPLTQPRHQRSLCSRFDGWLPEGTWYDIQTGLRYSGGRRLSIYRPLERMGLFAKAGAILPLSGEDGTDNSLANPSVLAIKVFTGADGHFDLVEEAETVADTWASTAFLTTGLTFVNGKEVKLEPQGTGLRTYELTFVGAFLTDLELAGQGRLVKVGHNDQGDSLVRLEADGSVTLSFKQAPRDSLQVRLEVIFSYIEQAQMENQAKDQIWALVKKDMPIAYKMLELQGLGLERELVEPVIELLVTEP